jgi:hypothetical protein
MSVSPFLEKRFVAFQLLHGLMVGQCRLTL